MLLTKDNLVRFLKEKKALTPTEVAENFETTTMIASAALSELAKEGIAKITHLKLASSPYYYDPKQSSILIELGEKHLKGYDKELFNLLKERKIIPKNSLSIQLSLATERIKDFAHPLEINYEGKVLKFYIWYQENIKDVRNQIIGALNNQNIKKQPSNSKEEIIINKEEIKNQNKKNSDKKPITLNKIIEKDKKLNEFKENLEKKPSKQEEKILQNQKIIENYFNKYGFQIENKQKKENGIYYELYLSLPFITIKFDSFYFYKKPQEVDIIKFYSTTINPKIIFIENIPKKYEKLANSLDNLKIINL